MSDDIQTIVEGQHQQVSSKISNVVPHDVLLQRSGGADACLINDTTEPPYDLSGHQGHISRR